MYVIAIISDLLSLIPFVNFIVDPITGIIFWLVSGKDFNIYDGDGIGLTLFTLVIKEVPFIDIIPMWTIRVFLAKRAAAKRKAEEGS